MIGLKAEGITHRYGDHAVLRDVSLAIPKGQSHVIAGPNGSGKSTLLRILALLEEPTEGRVSIDGEPTSQAEVAARRREMALVAQPPYLFHGTVLSNVAYGLKVRRLPRAEIRERVESAITWAGLEEVAQQAARTLSVGQSQLVNLARAVALQPRVLDVRNAGKVEELVSAYASDPETTVLLVTHHLPQARRLAQNLTLLYEGQVVDSGPIADLLERADDPRAAAFLSHHAMP